MVVGRRDPSGAFSCRVSAEVLETGLGTELPGPRSTWELPGIPPRGLISIHSTWGGAETSVGDTGDCSGENWNATAELHLGRGWRPGRC